jgi:uncharacterized membrane protein YfcA
VRSTLAICLFAVVCLVTTVVAGRRHKQWASLKIVVVSFIGGWMSGALGLGGGAIFNPLLLNLGLPPVVSSATSMFIIIFSTGASTLSYATADSIDI